jgi:hypothetical protein
MVVLVRNKLLEALLNDISQGNSTRDSQESGTSLESRNGLSKVLVSVGQGPLGGDLLEHECCLWHNKLQELSAASTHMTRGWAHRLSPIPRRLT